MITVKEVLSKKTFHYLQQHTSQDDLTQLVTGVNRVESITLKHLIQRNELVVTTGEAMINPISECLSLLKYMKKVGAAALVINTGPYIKKVPEEVKLYAEEVGCIVIEMPWRIRIADMTKKIFEELVKRTKRQSEEIVFIEKLISKKITNEEIPVEIINDLGEDFLFEGVVVIVKQTNKREMEINVFHERLRELFHQKYNKFISGIVGQMVVFVINRSSRVSETMNFTKFGKELYAYFDKKKITIAIGKGESYPNITEVYKSYDEALQVITVVQNQDEKWLFKYKDLGVYQFLFALKDSPILPQFCKEMLAGVWEYDRCNNQKYYSFLRVFLEENGHANAISKRLFIHRNTVSYRVQRIEKISDRSLTNNLDKTSLSLAILIDDLFLHNRADD